MSQFGSISNNPFKAKTTTTTPSTTTSSNNTSNGSKFKTNNESLNSKQSINSIKNVNSEVVKPGLASTKASAMATSSLSSSTASSKPKPLGNSRIQSIISKLSSNSNNSSNEELKKAAVINKEDLNNNNNNNEEDKKAAIANKIDTKPDCIESKEASKSDEVKIDNEPNKLKINVDESAQPSVETPPAINDAELKTPQQEESTYTDKNSELKDLNGNT